MIRESAIPVIDIQVIIFMEIVGDINIRVTVIIQVPGGNAQAVSNLAAVNP
jgi:hypothetical protein